MSIADIVRNDRRGRRRPRGEGAQATHLRHAARLAGEAFACDDNAPREEARAGCVWNAAAATLIAGAMLFF